MKVKIGVVGYSFAQDFVRLFHKHPDVEKVCIAELSEERREQAANDYPGMENYHS